jgi:hypothetical protein
MYAITMTNIFNIFLCIFDTDVSVTDHGQGDESKMKVPMTALYKFQRDEAKGFYWVYTQYFVGAIVESYIIYNVFYYNQIESGILDSEGHVYGSYSFGIYLTAVIVFFHHI